jgi:hypothetical protein
MLGEAGAELREPVVDGIVLHPVGAGSRVALRTGPLAGGAIGVTGALVRRRKEQRELAGAEGDPSIVQGGWGYLVATATGAALFDIEIGPRKRRTLGPLATRFEPGGPAALILTRPTSRVGTAVELVSSAGPRYRFELPTVERRRLRQVAKAIGVDPDEAGLKPTRAEVTSVVVLLLAILGLLAYVLTNL